MKFQGQKALSALTLLFLLTGTFSYFSFTTLPPKKPEKDAETLAKERARRELLEKRKNSLGKIMGKALMAVLAEKKSRENLGNSQKELGDEGDLGMKDSVASEVKPDRELRQRQVRRNVKRSRESNGRGNLFLRKRLMKIRQERKDKCKILHIF